MWAVRCYFHFMCLCRFFEGLDFEFEGRHVISWLVQIVSSLKLFYGRNSILGPSWVDYLTKTLAKSNYV